MKLKNLFYRPFYVSEVTQFLNQLHANNPQLHEQQVAGRALLWDKLDLNRDQQQQAAAARVRQQAYVYQTKGKK